jgi:hypothetical protein
MEGGYPADVCGAICLSFRALGKFSPKIWPTNLEMNQIFEICHLWTLPLIEEGEGGGDAVRDFYATVRKR